ncbi:MAG TPA: hypothetical protein VL361_07330 [Candidatus Limnocylindrales bacterium]|nr:hypothetical protein [Candidatus Limnocylindrales bacterium]
MMRTLITAAGLLMAAGSVHAGLAGIEAGNGVAVTGGVVRVTFVANKSIRFSPAPSLRLSLMEVQLMFVDGKIKRHTMVFAGNHSLRAPLPIEVVEVLGGLCLLVVLCGIALLLNSGWRLIHADTSGGLSGGGAEPGGEKADDDNGR